MITSALENRPLPSTSPAVGSQGPPDSMETSAAAPWFAVRLAFDRSDPGAPDDDAHCV